jgi:4'-phosphopantetheinyl transferase
MSLRAELSLQWPRTSVVPELQPQSIHLWRLRLMAPQASQEQLWQTLSIDEQARSQRFIRSIDQHRFVVMRGTLRWLLGQYLDLEPAAVQFAYGEKGKPRLSAVCTPTLEFNLSHARDQALVAVTRDAEVGIDLEPINPQVDYAGITKRFLTPGEQKAIFSHSQSERCRIFFQIWTRKEACIKALGGSIGENLAQIDVSKSLDQPVTSVQFTHSEGCEQIFTVSDLRPAPGYIGAWAAFSMPSMRHQYSLDLVQESA